MEVHPVELVLPDEPSSVRLMNTTWLEPDGEMVDCLVDGADLRALLTAVGRRPPARPTRAQVDTVRDLRDALRTLAAGLTGEEPGVAALRRAAGTVNAALAAAPVRESLRAAADGWELGADVDPSFAGSVGVLARDGAALLSDHTRRPVRTCPAPSCGLYFVATHARRRWCSAHCADRVRAARYYRRHRQGQPG